MKDTLKPGMSAEQIITTTPEMGIVHLGPNAPRMFSTPAMIQLMEGTCVQFLTPHMDAGEQTVGFHVKTRSRGAACSLPWRRLTRTGPRSVTVRTNERWSASIALPGKVE